MKAPEAGNTVESLRAVDVSTVKPIANITDLAASVAGFDNEDLKKISKEAQQEVEIYLASQLELEKDPELVFQIDEEHEAEIGESVSAYNWVTREEFNALIQRIEDFNRRSGHRL